MNGTKSQNKFKSKLKKVAKRKSKIIAVDTNIFTYLLTTNSRLHTKAEDFFKQITEKNIHITTSVITLTELLSFKAPEKDLQQLENDLLSIPNLTIVGVSRDIAIEAANIRRGYNLRTPDAIQLATAKIAKTDVFVTNDKRLKAFKEVKVLLLNKITRRSF